MTSSFFSIHLFLYLLLISYFISSSKNFFFYFPSFSLSLLLSFSSPLPLSLSLFFSLSLLLYPTFFLPLSPFPLSLSLSLFLSSSLRTPGPVSLPPSYLPSAWACLALFTSITLHALFYLMCHWIIAFKAKILFSPAKKVIEGLSILGKLTSKTNNKKLKTKSEKSIIGKKFWNIAIMASSLNSISFISSSWFLLLSLLLLLLLLLLLMVEF